MERKRQHDMADQLKQERDQAFAQLHRQQSLAASVRTAI